MSLQNDGVMMARAAVFFALITAGAAQLVGPGGMTPYSGGGGGGRPFGGYTTINDAVNGFVRSSPLSDRERACPTMSLHFVDLHAPGRSLSPGAPSMR